MTYLKVSIGIFLILCVTRLIPHPPNFTSLQALSFYVPAILGIRYLPVLLLSFIFTDLFLGFHGLILFTWGSIVFIGLLSQLFKLTVVKRLSGALIGVCFFFIITNFGVWTLGSYGYTFQGLILCYTLAIPFFGNALIATFIISFLIEIIYKIKKVRWVSKKI